MINMAWIKSRSTLRCDKHFQYCVARGISTTNADTFSLFLSPLSLPLAELVATEARREACRAFSSQLCWSAHRFRPSRSVIRSRFIIDKSSPAGARWRNSGHIGLASEINPSRVGDARLAIRAETKRLRNNASSLGNGEQQVQAEV